MRRDPRLVSLVVVLSAIATAKAATKYPGLNAVFPVAVERGKKTTVMLETNGDVKTAYKVLLEGTGIRARVLPRSAGLEASKARIEVEVAADAAPGPREIRLATRESITTVGRIFVSPVPVALEPETRRPGNADPALLPLSFPSICCGRLSRPVEEDWFTFEATQGEHVSFTVWGTRLHDTIHKIGRFINHLDTKLVIVDEDGTELAANDDFYFADPLLSYRIPKTGRYRLKLQESTYKGNPFYTYALMAHKGPWPLRSQPLAIAAGKTQQVSLRGIDGRAVASLPLTMPSDAVDGSVLWLGPAAPMGTPLLPVLCDSLPTVVEVEENDSPGTPQSVAFPCGVEGLIDRPDDVDHFAFAVKKGTTYEFEVFARRLFSPLDASLAVLDRKGKKLAANDDFRTFRGEQTKDALLSWRAPADGEYLLAIRDVMGRGGADFAYRLRCRAGEPDFDLTCDPSLFMVGPGSRAPLFVRAYRRNGFDGPIALAVKGLPKGMTASAATIPSGLNDTCMVLEVAKDAEPDASNLTLEGTALLESTPTATPQRRRAVPLVEIYQAQRRPGKTIGAAITEPSDIRVETTVTRVVLRPGESKEIPITVVRAPKYANQPVTLWGDWRFGSRVFGTGLPPGVTVDARKSKLALNGNENEGKVTLTCATNAKPALANTTAVLGQVAIEFSVFVPFCTHPITVEVVPKSAPKS